MNLCAIIQCREYPAVRAREFVVMLYDQDKPRMTGGVRDESRYEFVRSLGPFSTKDRAVAAARKEIAA